MVYVFLADGFEETEAIVPIDILRRGGVNVLTVGVGGKIIAGSHNIQVTADVLDKDMKLMSSVEMVILPGGKQGVERLMKSPYVSDALKFAAQNEAYLAAICAAPSVLGRYGYLRGKNYTCYPGFESVAFDGNYVQEEVITDGKIITGIGAGVSMAFAKQLLTMLKGEKAAEDIAEKIFY